VPPALEVPLRRCPLSLEDDIAVRDSISVGQMKTSGATQLAASNEREPAQPIVGLG
jgi:hypothetical protein